MVIFNIYTKLKHLSNERVNMLITLASITTFDEMLELAISPATQGRRKLEGPDEVGSLLEVGTDGVNFVNQILDRQDRVLAQSSFDDSIVRKSNALFVDLTKTTLVKELTNSLKVRNTISNIRFNDLKHFFGSLVKFNKDTVVDLNKTE